MRSACTILMLLVLMLVVSGALAQESTETLPKVVQHSEPIYPPIARTAHIQGEVRVKLTTNGESVTDAEAETGPPLLHKAAEDNVRTWKFAPHTASTFHVTFRYKIMSSGVDIAFLESPDVVQLTVPPPEISIYYGSVGLGTWNAQLKSAHGKSRRVFKLTYSGPDGDWLDGDALGPKGECDEIDFGHKEGNFLAFTITLSQPDGQRVKSFFVGRISGNQIIGTFVDDVGITGEWTALREADKPNP
jgi:Gram-negative bacterial TonB protein C-terminal